MYARLQTIGRLPAIEDATALRRKAMDIIAGHPGFAGLYAMEQFGGHGNTALTLWETEEDARLASDRTATVRGPRPFALETDQVYEVQDTWTGVAAGQEPKAAVVLYFDGPMNSPGVEAARRAGRDRVIPALSRHPGLIGGFVLWQTEARAFAAVILAVSLDALDESGKVVNSTELLPGEDPALLPGPDRAVVHRVVVHRAGPRQPA